MFKKILVITLIAAAIGLLIFGAVNRTITVSASPETTIDNGNGRGSGYGDGTGTGTGIGTQVSTGDLNADETGALIFMREEEKLARDVYSAFYTQWGLAIFQNISQGEQAHMDAVKTLIDRYTLTDPASSQAGLFTNPDLQKLYNDLIARGSQSLGEALKVGVAIEEIDILDLQFRLTKIDNSDIIQVFNNLKNGSYNHLKSFVSTLQTQTGEVYQPQHLSQEAYQAILDGTATTGNGGGKGRGKGTH